METWGKAEAEGANASGCTSAELPGFLWSVCCHHGCGKILGLKLGLPEDDGKLSHSLCQPHLEEAMSDLPGGMA